MLPEGHLIDGKYRVVRVIGRGGMGIVYEGLYARIQRRVAIKVLHAEVAAKPEMVQRFEREGQVAGRIGSEHVVEVLDAGALPTGQRFLVMEYLEGESLGARLKARTRLAPIEAAVILRQILVALVAAHRAGVGHRDVKRDNVFLVDEKAGVRDFVKLVDFGVSKLVSEEDLSITRSGVVMGTPYYMSPEQARGGEVTPASDVYAAAVVAYQAVTGQVPFLAKSFTELLFKIALERPAPISTLVPSVDPAFADLVMHGLAREPEDRLASASVFLSALDAWLGARGEPTSERRASHPSQPPVRGSAPSMHPALPAFVATEGAPRPQTPLPVRFSPARDPLATSHSALTVTSGERSSSRVLVASVMCLAALAGIGIAVFGSRVTNARDGAATVGAPHGAAANAPSTASAAPPPQEAEPPASAALHGGTAAPSTTVSDDAVVTLEGSPETLSSDPASPTPKRGARGGGSAPPARSGAPTPDAPGAKGTRGRVIDGTL